MGRTYFPSTFKGQRCMRWPVSTMPQGLKLTNGVQQGPFLSPIYSWLIGIELYPAFFGENGLNNRPQATWSRTFLSDIECDCFGLPLLIGGKVDYIVNFGADGWDVATIDPAAIAHSFVINFTTVGICWLQRWQFKTFESTIAPSDAASWDLPYDFFGIALGCQVDLQFGWNQVSIGRIPWVDLDEPIVYDPADIWTGA